MTSGKAGVRRQKAEDRSQKSEWPSIRAATVRERTEKQCIVISDERESRSQETEVRPSYAKASEGGSQESEVRAATVKERHQVSKGNHDLLHGQRASR